MNYPLSFNFKIIALASQINAFDAGGTQLFYVKQKLLKLKEKIEVYKDPSKSQLLFTINADRVIDFSPLFIMADANGQPIGTIKRNGRISLWKASYDIELAGQPVAHVAEVNPWVKVINGLFEAIPFIGLLAGYVFQPKYSVSTPSGTALAEIEKKPAFFESKFILQSGELAKLDETKQQHIAMLLMVAMLRERLRS